MSPRVRCSGKGKQGLHSADQTVGSSQTPPVENALAKTQPGGRLAGAASASIPPSAKMLRFPQRGAAQLPMSLCGGGGGKGFSPLGPLPVGSFLLKRAAASLCRPGGV